MTSALPSPSKSNTDEPVTDELKSRVGCDHFTEPSALKTVYAEPPKSGISLVAWAMPTVYLIIGAVLVVFVIARWRKVPVMSARTAGAAHPSHISQELLDRARSRAARDTED